MTLGWYEYSVADYRDGRSVNGRPYIARHRMRVEVLERLGAWVTVRFMAYHADGRGPGTTTRVRNKNVKRDEPMLNLDAPVYRAPYKD